jgi:hypothetical protein
MFGFVMLVLFQVILSKKGDFMPEKVLVFGNLGDILFAKEQRIVMLQDEIIAIREEFKNKGFCKLYCKQSDCNGCPHNNNCDVAIKTLKDEIRIINEELSSLSQKDYYEITSLP